MKLSATLAADLATLTEALDEPDADLERTLRTMTTVAAAATATFAGLSAAVRVNGEWTTVTTLAESVANSDVVTSLRIPLGMADTAAEAQVVLYATRAGAFVDLAADLSWLTGRPLDVFALDADLAALPALLAVDGMHNRRAVDQAIGVLMAQGRTREEASAELAERAWHDGRTAAAAARAVLRSLKPGAPDS